MPTFESTAKISVGIELLNLMELPNFGQGKRLTCSGSTTILELINFLHSKLDFEKHIICSRDVPFNASKYVELVIMAKIQGESEPVAIGLENDLTLMVV